VAPLCSHHSIQSAGPAALLIISGSNDRAVYAVCRVAVRLNLEFHIVASGHSDRILLGSYRGRVCYVRESRQLDFDLLAVWVRAARQRSARQDIPLVVLPSSEFLNRFLLQLRGSGALKTLGLDLPLVDAALYELLSDKASAVEWAQSMGLKAPKRYQTYSSESLPLVAKPISNLGQDGLVLYPQLIYTKQDLSDFLRHHVSEFYFPQELVGGNSRYLMGYLARDGRAWLHAQRNVAQQPGGKSMLLAFSDDFDRSPTGAKIVDGLRELGFFGLFMVEVKGPRHCPCFIEINPRPWGPLQLCVDTNSGILEAFLGDCLHGEPDRLTPSGAQGRKGRYLWLGGLIETWRKGGRICWHGRPGARRWLDLLRSLPHDIYLRADSWRVFWRELSGRSI